MDLLCLILLVKGTTSFISFIFKFWRRNKLGTWDLEYPKGKSLSICILDSYYHSSFQYLCFINSILNVES